MRDKMIAPDIFRKRLLIEGYYKAFIDEKVIEKFFKDITIELSLTIYGQSVIHKTGNGDTKKNAGFDAFVPLSESGIYLGVWIKQRFLSLIIYSCKNFDNDLATEKVMRFFGIDESVSKEF